MRRTHFYRIPIPSHKVKEFCTISGLEAKPTSTVKLAWTGQADNTTICLTTDGEILEVFSTAKQISAYFAAEGKVIETLKSYNDKNAIDDDPKEINQ